MAIPYNPFANRDKTPVSPKVPGTLPGVPFDSDMDKDITKEDKDAFAEIEKEKIIHYKHLLIKDHQRFLQNQKVVQQKMVT